MSLEEQALDYAPGLSLHETACPSRYNHPPFLAQYHLYSDAKIGNLIQSWHLSQCRMLGDYAGDIGMAEGASIGALQEAKGPICMLWQGLSKLVATL